MAEHHLAVVCSGCSFSRRPGPALARTDASVALRTSSGSRRRSSRFSSMRLSSVSQCVRWSDRQRSNFVPLTIAPSGYAAAGNRDPARGRDRAGGRPAGMSSTLTLTPALASTAENRFIAIIPSVWRESDCPSLRPAATRWKGAPSTLHCPRNRHPSQRNGPSSRLRPAVLSLALHPYGKLRYGSDSLRLL
jgi:hypothetical protein